MGGHAGVAADSRVERHTDRVVRWRVRGIAAVAFVLLGWAWALTQPLMAAPDEPAHALRAVSIWHGALRPPTVTEATAFGERETSSVTVEAGYVAAAQTTECFRYLSETTAECAPSVPSDRTPTATTTAAGTYPPVYYLLVGWPSRLLPPEPALYAIRLVSATICGLLVAWGVGAAYGTARNRFVVTGAVLAVTPMALYLFGAVNPNSFEIAAAIGTGLAALELVTSSRRAGADQLVGLAVTASALAVARPLSPLFLAGGIAAVLLVAADRDRLRQLRSDRRLWAVGAVVGLAVASTLAWVAKTDPFGALSAVPTEPVDGPLEAARVSAGKTSMRVWEMLGYLGWLEVKLPGCILWGWAAATGALATAALVLGTWRQRAVLVAVAVATVALPVLSEASSAEELGFIWQGRYSLPAAVMVPVLAAWMVARSPGGTSVRRTLAAVVAVGWPIAQLGALAFGLTRWSVGARYGTLGFLGEPMQWRPPVPLVVLGLVAAVGTALVGVLTATGALAPQRGREVPSCPEPVP